MIMKRSIILEIIAALLILLFLYTSVSKWMDFREFIHDMHNQPFPRWMATSLVWALPPVEIFIALALMFDKTRVTGLWTALILMSLFTIYTAAILLGLYNRVPCGCGGLISGLTWGQHLFFNSFFLIISAAGIILNKKNHSSNMIAARQAAGAVQ